ncbi:PRK06851 family protein [Clostridium sp. SM-530-WT-3G]|uniref:PRK06851 family protein n=1 Tax=Clostridium sp. SM-530-WT-3G TaxID=2725303 RepID=UPI00145E04F1|nr:PRK06851 family protein [Clostridium sp. SM-530-WT-3G]NME82550.1 ATPase [Clostridium sp. SM-530-WT-3G]
MSNIKVRHLFPGNNTSEGFFSFYEYILPQKEAKRIFCMKGGPGTGKSSFMKKIGDHFYGLGYTIEYHHCSSDPNSLDGIVIKELNVAILDGTSPHVVDPIHPGAVDEVINLGDSFDTSLLEPHKKEIMLLTQEISSYFNRAYRLFASARKIHEDWASINSSAININKVYLLIDELKKNILTSKHKDFGLERHLFSTALTPDGILSYNKELANEIEHLYIIKGGPGLKKTQILKAIGHEAQRQGYFVEYFHDPLIPDRIENVLIPDISTGLFTTNEISRINYNSNVLDMKSFCDLKILNDNSQKILFDKRHFDILINEGLSCITTAHEIHDKLETYYIGSMDFSKVDSTYEAILNKIESIKN